MSVMTGRNAKRWPWVEAVKAPSDVTIENLITAYRLEGHIPCTRGHSRPCKNNPRCTNGMGEKQWSQENPPNSNSCDILRKDHAFAGLINWGSLCYSNVCLQLWFHTKAFRQDVYSCNIEDEERDNPTLHTLEYVPKSKLGMLQLLFAEMEFGKAKTVDPKLLVEGLKLSTSMQQDAHEFYTLFIGSPLSLKTLVSHHFRGTLEYRTRCHQCNNVRSNPSDFYNLALNLGDSETSVTHILQQHLADESLEGDDRYACSVCGTKTDATKSIHLSTLPATLILQVMRFEFNREKNKRSKLQRVIYIPQELDMTGYVNLEECEHHDYRLRAIIVHIGTSCNGGHYIAMIKNNSSDNNWHVFSDHNVHEVSTDKLPDLMEHKAKPKVQPGMIASNTAYMLVYESKKQKDTETKLPEWLDDIMRHRSKALENEVSEQLAKELTASDLWMENRRHMTRQLPMLWVENPVDADLISLEWLTSWIKQPDTAGVIKHEQLTCTHNKLHPKNVTLTRCITSQLAEELYEKYSGGPRFKTPSCFCKDCIVEICSMETKLKLIEDNYKKVQGLLKPNKRPSESTLNYWVSKSHYSKWRKMARSSIEGCNGTDTVTDAAESEGEDGEENKTDTSGLKNGSRPGQVKRSASEEDEEEEKMDCSESGMQNSSPQPGPSHLEQPAENPPEKQEVPMDGVEEQATPTQNGVPAKEEKGFNEDLLCVHGGLVADVSLRRLVPKAAWDILASYFTDAPEFSETTEPCASCLEQVLEMTDQQQVSTKVATEMKQKVPHLLQAQQRSAGPAGQRYKRKASRPRVLYLLHKDSAGELCRYLRFPNKCEPPLGILNAPLLCEHGGVQVDVGLNDMYLTKQSDYDTAEYLLVPEDEWLELEARFSVDHRIELITEHGGQDHCNPELCLECLQMRRNLEQYSYVNVMMPVRRISEAPREPSPPANVQGRPSRAVGRTQQPPESMATTSLRLRRRQKRDIMISVSATDTLRSIKLKIVKELKGLTMASDIHLSMDGIVLDNDDATLRELGVQEDAVLMLREDRPAQLEGCEALQDGGVYEAEASSNHVPELGFQGTLLGAD